MSNWVRTKSSKNKFVKIVHRGGQVELHYKPIEAAEVMLKNPKCIVAHPNVFKQPWSAVVAPDTTLNLGQKFYVVPMNTIRKLQRRSFKKNSRFRVIVTNYGSNIRAEEGRDEKGSVPCWSFVKFKNKKGGEYVSLNNNSTRSSSVGSERELEQDYGVVLKKTNCLVLLFSKIKKMKVGRMRKGNAKNWGKESPRRSSTSIDHWQPHLESVNEEKSL